ncbi:hypothetical protein U2446_15150, partial [Listeria monocytogenes]|uniref:hypothetical protein n=1 Tax=Listeria monocytogenes TaxID=1639 RepID=UPI002FDBF8C1
GLRIPAAAIVCCLYWVIGGVAFLAIGFVLGPLLPREHARRVGLGLIQRSFAGFVRLLRRFRIAECEFIGFEQIGTLGCGFIIAPNHP